MKVMAILAVLVGALEALNVIGDLVAGGQAGRSALPNLVVAAAGLAALLLLAGGVALLVRPRNAARFAAAAALFCLIVFALIAALRPFLSTAASLLGIGFPIALLVFLYRDSGRGPSAARR
jgi:uncharacterized membrane protein YhaH (DUF805 family)